MYLLNLIIICLCHRIIGTGKMSFINSSMRNILKLELKKFNLKDINFRKYQLARVTDNTEETIFTNEDHCILTVIEAVSCHIGYFVPLKAYEAGMY